VAGGVHEVLMRDVDRSPLSSCPWLPGNHKGQRCVHALQPTAPISNQTIVLHKIPPVLVACRPPVSPVAAASHDFHVPKPDESCS